MIGALLLALYQHRVPFESSLALEERRAVLADRFGTQAGELVRRYTSFESEGLAAFMGAGAAVDNDLLTPRRRARGRLGIRPRITRQHRNRRSLAARRLPVAPGCQDR